jgi:hypothetical protein
MQREDFQNQLTAATYRAIRFAQNFVGNRLSLNPTYVVLLNQSNDENRTGDEVVFPADKGRMEKCLSEIQVVDLLLRNSRCPVWIDINVAGSDENLTLLRLNCAGRYLGEERRLYYYLVGCQPFGIKSPYLPPAWKKGEKFRLKPIADAVDSIAADHAQKKTANVKNKS